MRLLKSRQTASTWPIACKGASEVNAFELKSVSKLQPAPNVASLYRSPDAIPGIESRYVLTDEQALLAGLRYNRLIRHLYRRYVLFQAQNQLRTTACKLLVKSRPTRFRSESTREGRTISCRCKRRAGQTRLESPSDRSRLAAVHRKVRPDHRSDAQLQSRIHPRR